MASDPDLMHGESRVREVGGFNGVESSGRRGPGQNSGIIVFGGGSRGGGCSTTGCLLAIAISVALSVGLTVLVNLILFLL